MMSTEVSQLADATPQIDTLGPPCVRSFRDVNDPFFLKGYQLAWRNEGSVAIYHFDPTTSPSVRETTRRKEHQTQRYPCGVLNCTLSFDSLADCDAHYEESHIFQCFECFTILPTAKLLDLHLEEAHDSFFAAAVERGKAKFSCLVCDEAFDSIQNRKNHLVAIHRYPKWFRFVPEAHDDALDKKKHSWIINHSKSNKLKKMDKEPDSEKQMRRERQNQKRSKIPCKFFSSRGGCWRGGNCIFLHTTSVEELTDHLATLTVPETISFGRKRR